MGLERTGAPAQCLPRCKEHGLELLLRLLPGGGGMPHRGGGAHGEAPGSAGMQRGREELGTSLYCHFHGEEQTRHNQQTEDWLV